MDLFLTGCLRSPTAGVDLGRERGLGAFACKDERCARWSQRLRPNRILRNREKSPEQGLPLSSALPQAAGLPALFRRPQIELERPRRAILTREVQDLVCDVFGPQPFGVELIRGQARVVDAAVDDDERNVDAFRCALACE